MTLGPLARFVGNEDLLIHLKEEKRKPWKTTGIYFLISVCYQVVLWIYKTYRKETKEQTYLGSLRGNIGKIQS